MVYSVFYFLISDDAGNSVREMEWSSALNLHARLNVHTWYSASTWIIVSPQQFLLREIGSRNILHIPSGILHVSFPYRVPRRWNERYDELIVPPSRNYVITNQPTTSLSLHCLLCFLHFNVLPLCVVVLWPQGLYLCTRKNRYGHWGCAGCRRVERPVKRE